VGVRRVAVIDAGPESPEHMRALANAVRDADEVFVVLTHGHRDHAPGAFALAGDLGLEVWGPEGLEGVERPLCDGDVLSTDSGDLVAIDTPGHARQHLAFHWPSQRALFAGDLLLGRGDTTWVGEYSGCVADYLTSLNRLSSMDLAAIYPAHGPYLDDPAEAVIRYQRHREDRIRQVAEALRKRPGAEEEDLVDVVYGSGLPKGMRQAAALSIRALMEYAQTHPERG